MLTDEFIKKQFIQQIIRRDAAFIYETQARVLRQHFTNERAKALASFLASRPFSVSGNGLKLNYNFSIYPYLRFLDIVYSRKQEGSRSCLPLYNRLIWGRLYHETISDLRYGFTQDMKKAIRERLEKINPDKL